MADDEPAILYARYSPRPEDSDDTCPSIDNQTERMLAYCAFAGLTPSEPITDPLVSARKTALAERPGGRLLLARLGYSVTDCACCGQQIVRSPKAGRAHMVVYALDRMFRDLVDGIGWLERWARDGIRLHTAGGVLIDASTADGWLCAAVQVLMASYEPRKTAERTSHGMRRHQANGRRMSNHAPYGKRRDPQDETRWIDDPHEQKVLRRIRELAGLGYSATEIAHTLRDERWKPRGEGWHAKSIERIIRRG